LKPKKLGATFTPMKQKKAGRGFTAAIKSSTEENNVWQQYICVMIPLILMSYFTGLGMIIIAMRFKQSLELQCPMK